MNWRESFLVDSFGSFRWFQAMCIEDDALIEAVQEQGIIGEIIVGTEDSLGCLEFGVKVGAA